MKSSFGLLIGFVIQPDVFLESEAEELHTPVPLSDEISYNV